eukprot:GEMP01035967.1.p1 GENE.GEMP01035967.1~~GEMP01035967.1.p1  ORF type:complete len:241 (+),score=31.72 GEMP01035967.1:124-846(+)
MSKRKLLIPCLVQPNTSTTQPASLNVEGSTSTLPRPGATSLVPCQAPRAPPTAPDAHPAAAHNLPAVASRAYNADPSYAPSAPTAVVVAGAPDCGPANGFSAAHDPTAEEPANQPALGGFMLRGGTQADTTARNGGPRKGQKSLLPMANAGSVMPPRDNNNNNAPCRPVLNNNNSGNDDRSCGTENDSHQHNNGPPCNRMTNDGNNSGPSSEGGHTFVLNYNAHVNAGNAGENVVDAASN